MSQKISFKNDYSEGAHPEILTLLLKTNLDQETGYGDDSLSKRAKELIKDRLHQKNASIYFVSGGTQANLLVISQLLKPYESVIAADTGHIHVHETGAIEHAGFKINLMPHQDGKITVPGIEAILREHQDHHMVKPRLVYISQTTEIGTIYSKKELKAIADCCKINNLLLFMDGARLGVSFSALGNTLNLADIASLCDVFYIGATKNGGFLGEAIVFKDAKLAEGFPYLLKQKGALMAKGRILGAQFQALFENNLYFELAEHANKLAQKISAALREKGYSFKYPSCSNQIFPIVPKEKINALNKHFDFFIWEPFDENNSVLRLVTSWASKEDDINQFIKEL